VTITELGSDQEGAQEPAPTRLTKALTVARTIALVAAFGLLLFYCISDPERIGWDAAAYVQWGDEIARGRVPFAEIVDVNPPLVQFLHVPFALLARALRMPPILVFNLCVFAATVLSGWALAAALRRFFPSLGAGRRFAIVVVFALGHHFAWAGGHFGQREQFIVMAMVPALVVRWARYEGRDVARGLLFGCGVALTTAVAVKPHFALPWAMFELSLMLQHRRLPPATRAEGAGALFVALAYGALFLLYPAMRREFFGHYLALFAQHYAVYDCSLRDLLSPTELWFALLLTGTALALPQPRETRGGARAFACFAAGCSAVYLAQHRGWEYQLLPAVTLAPLALALVLPFDRVLPLLLSAGGLTLSLASHARTVGRPLPAEASYAVLRSALEYTTRPGDSALILSTGTLGPYPLQLKLGVRPGSRFAWLPLLAMFYPAGAEFGCHYRVWGEGLPAERKLLEDLLFDIHARRPTVIVASSEESQALRPGCSVAAWLRESGLLARAMTEYVALPPGPDFQIWGLRGVTIPR
jgi:hypothetical protein